MLYDLLSEYSRNGVTPMHMPGHKRNAAMLGDDLPYRIDITEIDGFDNLHDARGVLKELGGLAAQLYRCAGAFPLVNGATGGILATVHAACHPGGTVIMARNCHKSVYNAVLINGLKPVYLLPPADGPSGVCGSVTPEQVALAVGQHPDAELVIVTSPTYEGVVSDIEGICEAAHRFGIPVLVDAAHGAHLGFSRFFPPDPIRCGADLVIVSLHKTLPALTQCALALMNSQRIDENRFRAALTVFQTSSPSYVLLSSIDRCVRLLLDDRERLFEGYVGNLKNFNKKINSLEKLRVLCHGADTLKAHPGFRGFDPGKLVVVTCGASLSGPALIELLRTEYKIEAEMACAGYAVAMTSICDEPEAFERFSEALLDIDRNAAYKSSQDGGVYPGTLPLQALTPCEASRLQGEDVPLPETAGRISLEYVWAYPPGIPFLVPGEVIGAEILKTMAEMTAVGLVLKSTRGTLPATLYCIAHGGA